MNGEMAMRVGMGIGRVGNELRDNNIEEKAKKENGEEDGEGNRFGSTTENEDRKGPRS